MADAMFDARHEVSPYRGDHRAARRAMDGRRESPDCSAEPRGSADISEVEVARRYGAVRGLLTAWRRKFASSLTTRWALI